MRGSLDAFVAVARLGAVGRAAQALGRTQPSVSARIKTLEAAWGVRLFRRRSRGMSLTPEGARLLPRAEAVLRELEELERLAGRPVTAPAELRVGAGDALGREVLPRALAALLREHPGLEVQIREGPGPRLLDALREGEIDLALVVDPGASPAADDLDLAPLIRSDVQLLVQRGQDARPSGRALPLSGLAGRRLVTLQPGSRFRRHLELAWLAAGLPLRPAVEVGNLSLVRRFVAAGLGVAPVPAVAFATGQGLAGVSRRKLRGVPPVTYLRAVRRGVPRTAPTERLLALLESTAKALAAKR